MNIPLDFWGLTLNFLVKLMGACIYYVPEIEFMDKQHADTMHNRSHEIAGRDFTKL